MGSKPKPSNTMGPGQDGLSRLAVNLGGGARGGMFVYCELGNSAQANFECLGCEKKLIMATSSGSEGYWSEVKGRQGVDHYATMMSMCVHGYGILRVSSTPSQIMNPLVLYYVRKS